MHSGSCNTVQGCRAIECVRVNPALRYTAKVSTVLVDMEDETEKLAAVSIGGRLLGECNPKPTSDFVCGFFECFRGEDVPVEASSTGQVCLEVHSVRTNNDCTCNLEEGTCIAAGLAALYQAMGENV